MTRPTADRTRQALFNVLEHAAWGPDLQGARVIDLFAGSGALGIEALSRGAGLCLFVERAEPARTAIRANLAALGLAARGHIDRRDAATLPARSVRDGEPYDLALLDPPYGEGLGEAALGRLAAGDWLSPAAVVALERGAADAAAVPEGFEFVDERRWGAARVSFLRRA